MRIDRRDRRWIRWRARAPRIALFGTLAILSLAGVRAAFHTSEPAPRTLPSAAVADRDLAVRSFAESFVRLYLN